MRRAWIIALAVSLGVLQVHFALAVVSAPAQEHAERGYALLAQARLEAESTTRERLLTAAIGAFKEAYQSEPTDPTIQVHALLGAAQAELLVQHPRRVSPFLWQATPLQRAEKNLQQALFLQPDNASATFLLGLAYWRQPPRPQAGSRVLSNAASTISHKPRVWASPYVLPLRLSGKTAQSHCLVSRIPLWHCAMSMPAVLAGSITSYLVYRPAMHEALFAVVVTGRQAYPLAADSATGALAPQGLLEAITTTPQPGKPPILVLRLRQGTRSIDTRFTWDGVRFVSLLALP